MWHCYDVKFFIMQAIIWHCYYTRKVQNINFNVTLLTCHIVITQVQNVNNKMTLLCDIAVMLELCDTITI